MEPRSSKTKIKGLTFDVCLSGDPIDPNRMSDDDDGPRPLAMLPEEYFWDPGSVLKVKFLGGNKSDHIRIAKFANQWSEYANIKFDFQPASDDSHIRIGFNEPKKWWSHLGRWALNIPNDQPTMNLGVVPETSDEDLRRHVLHEFGHALGCVHEHSSPAAGVIPWDKPYTYEYYRENRGWDTEQVDYNIFAHYTESQLGKTQFSQFDPKSIMVYAIPKEFTDGRFEVPWNTELSAIDKAFIGTKYPFNVYGQANVSRPAPTEEPPEPKSV